MLGSTDGPARVLEGLEVDALGVDAHVAFLPQASGHDPQRQRAVGRGVEGPAGELLGLGHVAGAVAGGGQLAIGHGRGRVDLGQVREEVLGLLIGLLAGVDVALAQRL